MPRPVADWPLLLCGPMLRTVMPTSVNVFVALMHPRKVRLSVLPPRTSTTPVGHARQLTPVRTNAVRLAICQSPHEMLSNGC